MNLLGQGISRPVLPGGSIQRVIAALHGRSDDILQLLIGGQLHLDAGLGGKGLSDLLPHISAIAGLDGGRP